MGTDALMSRLIFKMPVVKVQGRLRGSPIVDTEPSSRMILSGYLVATIALNKYKLQTCELVQ